MRLPALLIVAVPAVLLAQNADTATLSPIVVTATRTPLSQSALPVAVTVIRGDDLRLRGITSVADALADVASAYVARSGSDGGTTSLFLRGGESKYVKVLIDGIAVNDPGGAYDFGSLTTDNVDRIEVVRGPASVIYGADAVTGVVNVITRGGAAAPSVDVDVRAGIAPREPAGTGDVPEAMRTSDVSARATGAVDATSYSLALARHASSGVYAFNNGYGNNVVSARGEFAPSAGTDVRLTFRYTDYQFHYPTNSGGTPVDSNAFRSEDRTVVGIEVGRRLTDAASATLALSSSINDGGTNDALDAAGGSAFVSQDKTRRRGAELRMRLLPVSAAAVTLGAQVEQEDQQSQSQGEFGGFPFTDRFRAARHDNAGYAELVVAPAEALTVTAGARVDDNERFGTFGTGRAGVSYRVGSTKLRATAGTAFREPSFFENYATGYVTGNPELHPEHSVSADAGVERAFAGGRVTAGVSLYAQQFREMIDFSGDTAACGFSYCNVARARADGAELDVDARIATDWSAMVSAAFLRTRVIDPGFDTTDAGLYQAGETLIRRPERTVSAELRYRGAGPLAGAIRLLSVGERSDRDFTDYPSVPVTLPAFQRLDASAEYAVPGVPNQPRITVRVENALNAHYETIYNFLQPRRTVWLGLRASM